ncbi:uncharacterized protein PFL1_06819 [Pseudozyma flocculosa PF-1]|uniref:Uncharacterized protein n=1 Tax=Pseudozyma flocculosa PF-1 TaxID=1277687 RepID=A0A061H1I1_9BASI|nr:uncharacterized protein PFL1_06819 [Pseudozyma flocculosa PF-1]EPQ25620.1 hypothetical protein PFL1_06819 [Pseudozyma flocculosa PF-1]
MAPRIQTFIDLYKNVDAVRRAKRYLQIKATKGDSRDNVELTALKYLMLVDHAVALDKKRSCQESNNRHMDCKKLTVNSYLLYKVVNNETFWLIPDVIFECEECTLNHYSCNVYFDMKDTNKTVLVNSKGIHGDFSVKSGPAGSRGPRARSAATAQVLSTTAGARRVTPWRNGSVLLAGTRTSA